MSDFRRLAPLHDDWPEGTQDFQRRMADATTALLETLPPSTDVERSMAALTIISTVSLKVMRTFLANDASLARLLHVLADSVEEDGAP